MNDTKYIELNVHQATIFRSDSGGTGKPLMDCVLKTKATDLLQLIHGLRGSLHVSLESDRRKVSDRTMVGTAQPLC